MQVSLLHSKPIHPSSICFHMELIFAKVIQSVSKFIFLAYGCPVVPIPLVEKTIFAPLYCLYSLVKDQLTLFMWVYFWALYSVCSYFVEDFASMFIRDMAL